jgi:hypothetical protein
MIASVLTELHGGKIGIGGVAERAFRWHVFHVFCS